MTEKKLSRQERIERAMGEEHAGSEEVVVQNNSLVITDPIAEKILTLAETADNQVRNAIRSYISIGKMLKTQRDSMPHGKFLKWFEKYIGPNSGRDHSFTIRMGYRYIEYAEDEEYVLSLGQISQRKILVALKEKREIAKATKTLNEDSPKARKLKAESIRQRKHAGEKISKKEAEFVLDYLTAIRKEKEAKFSLELQSMDEEIKLFSGQI
ncbi:hypothetical protein LEP1GSC084_1066 [Leptospira interrogans serovar Medanensis str. L0448]|uniref:hypothetical protein n=1 Tax=Leptospira interrogans TaxID=173 RepID=UPI000297AF63|nr:hypothetical protein [Leptospira interrogans]AJR16668.1 ParB [Leptospira interrogans serovar Linhai str. 56609]EKR82562.1 hypothetical protein LEP1GSC099_1439 [Leptospira interrogans str. UI 08452]EMN33187.1 hypothetical protein LEP1GSC084_1066 [Leptospira interrogans serovar Medanensis str. L0448]EMN38313.1 hypothetical protein LEP1GSC085_0033 [Leptospira interrogans str. L0996]